MPTLIKDGAIIDNPWHTVQKETELAEALDAVEDHVIVPFSLWQEHKGNLVNPAKRLVSGSIAMMIPMSWPMMPETCH